MTGGPPADETGATPTAVPSATREVAGESASGIVCAIPRMLPGEYMPEYLGTSKGRFRTHGVAHTRMVGQLGEAHAIAWLAGQGYEVFTPLGNAPCDLIALNPVGLPVRVEVKTSVASAAFDHGRRRVYYAPAGLKPENYDMLIWVLPVEGVLIVDPVHPINYIAVGDLDA